MTDLTNPIYTDETAARSYLENIRWPNGPVCPYCGVVDGARVLNSKSKGPGWYQCAGCASQYTVRVGTVYERSHVPLHKWVLANHLMCASKKGISAHQLHRMLGVTYKTAWFMAHRIREAMREVSPSPMGSGGKIVEADETYFGNVAEPKALRHDGMPLKKHGAGGSNKRAIVSLVERGGNVRSFHVQRANAATVTDIANTNISREARLFTDESTIYKKMGKDFADHSVVRHTAKEYARGEVHTNTVEGFFSIFKRGMKGVYQHCGEHHLHRYLAEFDFRYNGRAITDFERAVEAHRAAEGKRLTYRQPNGTRAG